MMASCNKKKTITGIATLVAGLVLAACGGSQGSSDDESAEGLTRVGVGGFPTALVAALELGVDRGIFEDHGIEVAYDNAQGGAALLPALASGELQFVISNPISVFQAVGQGFDVRIVSGYHQSASTAPDATAIVVKADSDIKSAADLAGKKVAINTLKNAGEMNTRAAVEKAGGDPASVEFVELAFGDMPAQLDSGNVDALWGVEPFLSSLTKDGAYRVVSYNYLEALPSQPTLVAIASADYVDGNGDTVKAFQRALTETLDYAQTHESELRDAVTGFLSLDPSVAADISLAGKLTSGLSVTTLEDLQDLMLKYDLADTEVDINSMVVEPPPED